MTAAFVSPGDVECMSLATLMGRRQDVDPTLVGVEVRYPDGALELPDAGERINVGSWAKTTAKALLPNTGMARDRSALRPLARRLAGWAEVNRSWPAPPTSGLLLLDRVSLAERAYVMLFTVATDRELSGPNDVERGYELHGTRAVAEPHRTRRTVPAGTCVRAFSLRESSFGGVRGLVRHLDEYIFDPVHPWVYVLALQWLDPSWDELGAGALDAMVESLRPHFGR